jgi:predicted ribosome-associated RNA-binding protein Tma20
VLETVTIYPGVGDKLLRGADLFMPGVVLKVRRLVVCSSRHSWYFST